MILFVAAFLALTVGAYGLFRVAGLAVTLAAYLAGLLLVFYMWTPAALEPYAGWVSELIQVPVDLARTAIDNVFGAF